jgi:hypothetical protein
MQRASRGIITMLALLVAAVCVGCGPVASGGRMALCPGSRHKSEQDSRRNRIFLDSLKL